MSTQSSIADVYLDNFSSELSFDEELSRNEEINRPEIPNSFFNNVEVAGDDDNSFFSESIGQVAGGFIDGLNEMGTFLNWASGLDVSLPNVSVGGFDLVVDGKINTTDAPETGVGGFIRGMSQFGAGLIPGLGVAKLAKLNNPVLRSLVAGGVADFSAFGANDPRLANFLREYGELNDPITKWLSAPLDDEEKDNEFVGRLKNSIEGAGLGVAFESILGGLRWVKKGAHRTRRQVEEGLLDEGETLIDEPLLKETTPEEEGFSQQMMDSMFQKKTAEELGDPEELDIFRGLSDEVKAELGDRDLDFNAYLRTDKKDLGINLDTIQSDDDIQKTLGALTDAFDDLLVKGRQGTGATETLVNKKTGKVREGGLSFQRTGQRAEAYIRQMAKNTQSSVDQLNGLYRDVNGLTTRIRASEALMEVSAKKLYELAEFVRNDTIHPDFQGFADGMVRTKIAYQMAKTRNAGIVSQILGVRSEIGRALNAYKITGVSQSAKDFQAKFFIDQIDPTGELKREAERLLRHKDKDNRNVMATAISKGYAPTFLGKVGQSLRQIYINGLLSGVDSTIANSMGNGMALSFTTLERKIASQYNTLFSNSSEQGVQAIEVAGLVKGFQMTIGDSWKVAKEAFITDAPSEKAWVKQELAQRNVITAENFSNYINPSGLFGTFIDHLGTVSRFPSRFMLSSDEVFRSLSYRMEQSAQAYVYARKTAGNDVKLFHRIHKEVMNMTPQQLREFKDMEGIDLEAQKATLEAIFATPQSNPLVKSIDKVRGQIPLGLGHVYIPFFNTIMNILRFSGERTVGANFLFKRSREGLLGDHGLRGRQMELAKLTTGSAMYTSAYMLADSGLISGSLPEDINLKRNLLDKGATSYSFVTPFGYIPFNRLDPIGTMLGFAADTNNLVRIFNDPNYFTPKESELVNTKFDTLRSQFMYQMMELMQDKAMLKGFAEIMSLISGDPLNRKDFLKKLANSYNPIVTFYSGFRSDVARSGNLLQQQTGSADFLTDLYTDFYNRNPEILEGLGPIPGYKPKGFSGKLYPKLDYVGKPVRASTLGNTASGRFWHVAQNMVSPAPVRPKNKSKLISKIVELGVRATPPSKWKTVNFRGQFDTHKIALSSEEQHYFAKTAGDLNRQYLEPLVTQSFFKSMPEGTQRSFLQNSLRKHRQIAKQMLFSKFPRLRQTELEFKQLDIQRLQRPSRTNPAFLR
tara:strand:+ start:6814 stop:10422 length:3609 start_codon:yes stop_codon:yes gene_type:complete